MRTSPGMAALTGIFVLAAHSVPGAAQEIDLGLYVTDYLDEQVVQIKPLGGTVTTTG